MEIIIPSKKITEFIETDVLVVGGGPAGIGAAVAAARQGSRVVLLEKRGFMGGNITAAYVETCNHFLKNSSFKSYGIYAEIEEKYRALYGSSGDIRPNAIHRFSSEYLKIFLDKFVSDAGVKVFLHSFVNDVIKDGEKITHVIIQSKKGPVAIRAGMIIDSTGDGDVAFAAGVPFDQGRDRDHMCQPGTVNFRIAGVDSKLLVKDGIDQVGVIGKRFREDYRAGKTNLSCKRQDIPCGRLTSGGQLTYINYPCAYGIDPTSFADLTRGEMECRRYIEEMVVYMRENFEGFENAELASIAPEIGFRDSRRFHGEYRLTIDDVVSSRHFDDTIAIFPQFYDMLSPDANMNEGSVEDAGYNGYICTITTNSPPFEIPYRSLLPVGIDNLLITGRCISADHVAESGIRAISACLYTGQAAGTSSGLALAKKQSPKNLNIGDLQTALRAQNVLLEY